MQYISQLFILNSHIQSNKQCGDSGQNHEMKRGDDDSFMCMVKMLGLSSKIL